MTMTTNNDNGNDTTPRDVQWWVQQIVVAIALGGLIFYGFSWMLGSI